jgi:hypothetical protein
MRGFRMSPINYFVASAAELAISLLVIHLEIVLSQREITTLVP